MMRLDKYLCASGVGTRNEVKKFIRQKRVMINDGLASDASIKVDEENDIVKFDNEPVSFQKNVYYMLNKPAGYISSTVSSVPNVIDLIHENYKGLFPCGRLDKDTEGLLLITNDGPLAHELLSPKKHIEKEYYVVCDLPITDEMISNIAKGITLVDGTKFKPAQCTKIDDYSCMIILHEGKYHEIKRIFKSEGNYVVYLKRVRMKNLVLDETLQKGEYRPLTEEELNDLKKVI